MIGYPAILDIKAQDTLLDEIEPVYTSADNVKFELTPTNDEILHNLKLSNLNAAPGSDGISGLVYKECWDSLGDSLSEVIITMFNGADPTVSMRTALMIFSSKPKKANSFKPSDKRRISILNSDFKLYEGLYAKRFSKLGYRTLSHMQYVTGKNRTIQHGITRARDAIYHAMKSGLRCGIGDQDYVAAFDLLVLSWVWRVLDKKGVNPVTLFRLKNLYKGGITIPVVNCSPGQAIFDMRGSLRQGGLGSMDWFAVGIDPLLNYLDKRLTGIPISILPVYGPQEESKVGPLTICALIFFI